jgi:hypothetical protein
MVISASRPETEIFVRSAVCRGEFPLPERGSSRGHHRDRGSRYLCPRTRWREDLRPECIMADLSI